MTDRVKVWGLRLLAFAALFGVCTLVGSGAPAGGFAVAFAPNGLFLCLYGRGTLRMPHFFEYVHPVEPRIYHWLGIGLVKRIVETRWWPMFFGSPPPAKIANREAAPGWRWRAGRSFGHGRLIDG